MIQCTALPAIDLSQMPALKKIDGSASYECTSLTSANLSNLVHLEEIGNEFMSRCSALRAIDLSSMTALTGIGHNAFENCSALTAANLSNLCAVVGIGSDFMRGCTALPFIDLSHMPVSRLFQLIPNGFTGGRKSDAGIALEKVQRISDECGICLSTLKGYVSLRRFKESQMSVAFASQHSRDMQV